MSLRDPTKKMSKSDPDELSRIDLLDSRQALVRKVRAAVTDSLDGCTWDPQRRPGIANLITIAALTSSIPCSPEALIEREQIRSIHELKQLLLYNVSTLLEPIQQRYWDYFSADKVADLEDIARFGAIRARKRAATTIDHVKQSMGIT